jgi:hypothetical protein
MEICSQHSVGSPVGGYLSRPGPFLDHFEKRIHLRFFSELNSSIPTLVALNSQFLEEKSLFLLATSHHRKHLDFSELPTIHCRETATINLNSSTEGSSWLFPNMATM